MGLEGMTFEKIKCSVIYVKYKSVIYSILLLIFSYIICFYLSFTREFVPESYKQNDKSYIYHRISIPGETIVGLSIYYYGKTKGFKEILDYNKIKEPRHIHLGDTIRVPIKRK